MKYKKPITYFLAGYFAAMPALAKTIDTPRSKFSSNIEDKVSSNYLIAMNTDSQQIVDLLNLKERETAVHYASAPKKHPWYSWFYRTWLGRATTAVIIGGIVYGVSAGGKKGDKNGESRQNPPPPPPPDPDVHDPDQPDF